MVQKQLLIWYAQNKRNLPWRNTSDPYIIWLSEVILQQTRVQQGLPYFIKFTDKYQSIKKLSSAPNDEIMKIWQGLGYYSRARNMHETAKFLTKHHHGKFPETYVELIKLKGIGPYTAAAIASFAFGEAVAVVDGNVYRVLSRFYAFDEPINSPNGKKAFAILADELLNKKEPALHNQAMMELGSLVCKPQNPNCPECPFQIKCQAFIQNKQAYYPQKLKKQAIRKRYFHYFYFLVQGKTAIYKRPGGDIWQNLYDLPLLEFDVFKSEEMVLNEIKEWNVFRLLKKDRLRIAYQTKHILTHQQLFATFWIVNLSKRPKLDGEMIWVEPGELKNYAISRLFDKFLINNKSDYEFK